MRIQSRRLSPTMLNQILMMPLKPRPMTERSSSRNRDIRIRKTLIREQTREAFSIYSSPRKKRSTERIATEMNTAMYYSLINNL